MCRSVLPESAFYIPAHGIVFQTVLELVDSGRAIDFVIVRQALRDRSALEEIGGVEALSDLLSFVPTAANAEFYIKIVREKFMLRRLIQACGKIAQECYGEQQEEIPQLMDRAEKAVFQITSDGPEFRMVTVKTRVMDALDRIECIYQARGNVAGLSTGFSDLDNLTGGLQPGEMIVFAGRPSMGKTALAVNIAQVRCMRAKEAGGDILFGDGRRQADRATSVLKGQG